MDPVHDRGLWTRSKEGAHGPCFVLTQISGPTGPTGKVTKGAYHLTEKSGLGVESIMVSDLPVYRRIAHPLRFESTKRGEFV